MKTMNLGAKSLLAAALVCSAGWGWSTSQWIWTGGAGDNDWANARNWVDETGVACPEGNYPYRSGFNHAYLPVVIDCTGQEKPTIVTSQAIEGWNVDVTVKNAVVDISNKIAKIQGDNDLVHGVRLYDGAQFIVSQTAFGHFELRDSFIGNGCVLKFSEGIASLSGERAIRIDFNSAGKMELGKAWSPDQAMIADFSLPLASMPHVGKTVKTFDIITWPADNVLKLTVQVGNVSREIGATPTVEPIKVDSLTVDSDLTDIAVGSYSLTKVPSTASSAGAWRVTYVDYDTTSDALGTLIELGEGETYDLATLVDGQTDAVVKLSGNATLTCSDKALNSLLVTSAPGAESAVLTLSGSGLTVAKTGIDANVSVAAKAAVLSEVNITRGHTLMVADAAAVSGVPAGKGTLAFSIADVIKPNLTDWMNGASIRVVKGRLEFDAVNRYPTKASVTVTGSNSTLKLTQATDTTGWESPATSKRLSIEDGGVLHVAKRDTFSMPLTLKSGKVLFNADNQDSGRAMDMHTGSSLTSYGDSLIGKFEDEAKLTESGIIAIRCKDFKMTVADGTLRVYAAFSKNSGSDGALIKRGVGTLALFRAADRNLNLPVSLEEGVLQLNDAASLTASGTYTISSGATLEFVNPTTSVYTQALKGTGTVKLTSGTLDLSDAVANFTGTFAMGEGATLTLPAAKAGAIQVPQGSKLILKTSASESCTIQATGNVVLLDENGNRLPVQDGQYTAPANTLTLDAAEVAWTDTTKWSAGKVPEAGEAIAINVTAENAKLTLADPAEVAMLTVNGTGALTIAGQKLTVANQTLMNTSVKVSDNAANLGAVTLGTGKVLSVEVSDGSKALSNFAESVTVGADSVFEKAGAGVLTLDKSVAVVEPGAQTKIMGGTLKFDTVTLSCKYWIGEGAMLDVNGKDNTGLDVTLAGGATLANSGADLNIHHTQWNKLTLEGDATILLSGNMSPVASGYGSTSITLNNHRLALKSSAAGSKQPEFRLCNTKISAGTIEIGDKMKLLVHSENGGHNGGGTILTDVALDFKEGCGFADTAAVEYKGTSSFTSNTTRMTVQGKFTCSKLTKDGASEVTLDNLGSAVTEIDVKQGTLNQNRGVADKIERLTVAEGATFISSVGDGLNYNVDRVSKVVVNGTMNLKSRWTFFKNNVIELGTGANLTSSESVDSTANRNTAFDFFDDKCEIYVGGAGARLSGLFGAHENIAKSLSVIFKTADASLEISGGMLTGQSIVTSCEGEGSAGVLTLKKAYTSAGSLTIGNGVTVKAAAEGAGWKGTGDGKLNLSAGSAIDVSVCWLTANAVELPADGAVNVIGDIDMGVPFLKCSNAADLVSQSAKFLFGGQQIPEVNELKTVDGGLAFVYKKLPAPNDATGSGEYSQAAIAEIAEATGEIMPSKIIVMTKGESMNDAAKVSAAVELFEGVISYKEDTKVVTIAYDFGISKMVPGPDGNVTVTAKVSTTNARAATYDRNCELGLFYMDGEIEKQIGEMHKVAGQVNGEVSFVVPIDQIKDKKVYVKAVQGAISGGGALE